MSEEEAASFPREPIDRLIAPFERFLHIEAASGVVLLLSAALALVLANSPVSEEFLALWKTPVGFAAGSFRVSHSLQHWINDGLMAIFFFVIGLEVKRELVVGELKDKRRAVLPIAAALGGMIVPAGVYLFFQLGEPGQSGWGITMATDIAFVVGCLALLGNRVPRSFRVFLLSLAIADDIGAILVIAIGYTDHIDVGWLVTGAVLIGVLLAMQRAGGRAIPVYVVLGAGVWFAAHESGVHATVAGVILGLLTPARPYLSQNVFARMLRRADEIVRGEFDAPPHRATEVRSLQRAARESISPLEYLEGLLHPWVSFVIMPLFALANAGVPISLAGFGDPVALAVDAGLVIGKPVGIVLFSAVAVRLGLATLPEGVDWTMMIGGGFLAGIGFTMALFIAGLALDGETLDSAKVGILGASAVAALLGMAILARQPSPPER